MKDWLKRLLFGLLRKNPEAVVVSFASGPPELAARMFEEVQHLVPDRRHFLITPGEFQGYGQLRARFRPYRIALAPVLFAGSEHAAMRRAAGLLAPGKILAYNSALERHHLRLRTWIASLLFVNGVPLDRIFLRPRWLAPWKKDRSVYATEHQDFTGRPLSPERPRIGVVTPYFPYPLSHGGAVRMHALIREMARKFDVVLFSFSDQPQTEVMPMLEYCARVLLIQKTRYREPRWSTLRPPEVAEFQSPAMHRLVRRVREEMGLELMQIEYTALAPYAGDILVEHDITNELYRQIFERERTLAARWDLWRWQRFERRWIARYRRVVVMSEDDRKLLNASNVDVIPNGVDLTRFQPEPERIGSNVLFVGSFRHFPNTVAFRFFVEQVWPLLKARTPEIRFTVVAGPDPLIHWRQQTGLLDLPANPGIEINGFIADMRPFYVDANIAVVPTLVSAGTNLKVIEALAIQRAVVSTPSGCAGLGLRHGETAWIAADASGLATGILQLLKDPHTRHKLATAGHEHARQFDWTRIGLAQRRLLRSMLPPDLQFRTGTAADLDCIWELQDNSPEASQWHREDYLNFDCTVALARGMLCGFLVSREVGPGEREILNIAIDPEYRRLGVASALIQAELRRWPGEHFLEVRESNVPARTLYERLGFKQAGVRPGYYEDPPESGIVMRFFS